MTFAPAAAPPSPLDQCSTPPPRPLNIAPTTDVHAVRALVPAVSSSTDVIPEVLDLKMSPAPVAAPGKCSTPPPCPLNITPTAIHAVHALVPAVSPPSTVFNPEVLDLKMSRLRRTASLSRPSSCYRLALATLAHCLMTRVLVHGLSQFALMAH